MNGTSSRFEEPLNLECIYPNSPTSIIYFLKHVRVISKSFLTAELAESMPLHLSCRTAFRLQNTPATTLVEDIRRSGRSTISPVLLVTLKQPEASLEAKMLIVSPGCKGVSNLRNEQKKQVCLLDDLNLITNLTHHIMYIY